MSSLLDKPDRILCTAEESPPLPTVLLLAVTHVALIFGAVATLLLLFGNRTIRLWTPLLGMGSGYAAAACFGLLNLTCFSFIV